MNKLAGKKVLLIALREYSKGIIDEMLKMGISVDYIGDKPNDGAICKTFGRLKVAPYMEVIKKYYSKCISEHAHKKYDYILCIRGEYTPAESLKELKKTFPDAKLILYMWDSIKNNKGIEKKWHCYDKVYTFDRLDYIAHSDQLSFLPLFYYGSYLPSRKDNYKYDIAFIGTGHEDRIQIMKGISKQCDKYGLNLFSYIFLPHKIVYIRNKILSRYYKNVDLSDVHFKLIPTDKAYKIYSLSKCVVDIESITQSGLTMRTIEMIGLRKKLITTNKDIVNYDFYNENNIMIVDRHDFKIDPDFINKPYVELSDEIYEKYSLHGWIEQVFDLEK